jgi:hypothetical protein
MITWIRDRTLLEYSVEQLEGIVAIATRNAMIPSDEPIVRRADLDALVWWTELLEQKRGAERGESRPAI